MVNNTSALQMKKPRHGRVPPFAQSHTASACGTEIPTSQSGLKIYAIDLYSVITRMQSHLHNLGHFRLINAQVPTKTKSFSTFNLKKICLKKGHQARRWWQSGMGHMATITA